MVLKKHSARSGGRVIKGDVALSNSIRRAEIIEEVVDNLRPWKNHKSRDAVIAEVKKALDILRIAIPIQYMIFDPRPFREHAKKLDKALHNVEALITSSPLTLTALLFAMRPIAPPIPVNNAEYSSVEPAPEKSFVRARQRVRKTAFAGSRRSAVPG